MIEMVKRGYVARFENDAEKTGYIKGVPIVFGESTDIGGLFEEVIERGAINEKILKDVHLYHNHRTDDKCLARSCIPLENNGGMALKITDKGVEMEAHLNLKRTDANDLYLAIEDGVMNGMSFMFGIEEERWERFDTDYPKRIITKINPIVEVSAVNFPAYKQTSIGVRSIESAETDLNVLEKARHQFNNKRSAEIEQLELLKLKNKNLFIGGLRK